MPGPVRHLTDRAARGHITERCLLPTPSTSRGRVGLECEWHVRPAADPAAAGRASTSSETGSRRWARLPGGSRVTYEPGGQLELSSPPAAGVAGGHRPRWPPTAAAVTAALESDGIELLASGVDPLRPPVRQLRAPRYDAMEAFFDGDGPEGRVMMTRTASVQVNLDLGLDDAERRAPLAPRPPARAHPGRRLRQLAVRLGPADRLVLDPAGQLVRHGPEPHRLRPTGPGPGAAAWVDYALGRPRHVRPRDGERYRPPAGRPLSFAGWLAGGPRAGLARPSTTSTTTSPRCSRRSGPGGWLELRFLDALPEPWWRVAAAATAVGLDDEQCRRDGRAGHPGAPTTCGARPPGSASATRPCHRCRPAFFAAVPAALRAGRRRRRHHRGVRRVLRALRGAGSAAPPSTGERPR